MTRIPILVPLALLLGLTQAQNDGAPVKNPGFLAEVADAEVIQERAQVKQRNLQADLQSTMLGRWVGGGYYFNGPAGFPAVDDVTPCPFDEFD